MKSIVKEITPLKDRQGNLITGTYQNKLYYTSIVEFENGDKGRFDHPEPLAEYFIVGADLEYRIENKGTWNKLRKPGGSGGFSAGRGWTPKTVQEVKRDAVVSASRHVTDMITAGVIKPNQYPALLAKVMDAICAEVDKIQ